jgi:hypothetical protein
MFALPLLQPSLTFVQPDISQVGLMCQYKFNNGNCIDSSGNGFTAVSHGSPTFSGTNVLLNGTSQNITISTTSSFVLPPMTINAWVKPTTGGFIWSETSTSVFSGYYIGVNTASISITSTESGAGSSAATITGAINGWHMVTVTLALDNARTIVLDGNTAGAITDATYINPSGTGTLKDNEIGLVGGIWTIDGFQNWYGGYLDDFRIYNRVIANSEILQLYKNGPR